MSLQATRRNPDEVRIDKNGKAVVVDRRKADARPRRAEKADPEPSSDGGPSDGSKPAAGDGQSKPDEKIILQWQQKHILKLFFLGCHNLMTKIVEYLQKEYLVNVENFQDSDVDEHGVRKVIVEAEEFALRKGRTLIPTKLVSPSFFAETARFELTWLAFIIESFDKDGTGIKKINNGFFVQEQSKNLSELEDERTKYQNERLRIMDKIEANADLDNDMSKKLNEVMQRIFLVQWLIARQKNDPKQQKKPQAAVASDLPRELTERMSELLQTPILYEAWMKETHRSVHPIDDNGQAI